MQESAGSAWEQSLNSNRNPRRRWRIAWLLGLGILVNYFDRVNLSVSHAALVTSFGISDITFGYLSAAYNWTYALCQLPVGVILDRFGVRRVGRVSTFVWSVASFCAAAATRARLQLNNWDRFTINLPFSKGALVWGEPIYVPRDADPETLEEARRRVEEGLNAVTAEADEIVGRPRRSEGAGAPAH